MLLKYNKKQNKTTTTTTTTTTTKKKNSKHNDTVFCMLYVRYLNLIWTEALTFMRVSKWWVYPVYRETC